MYWCLLLYLTQSHFEIYDFFSSGSCSIFQNVSYHRLERRMLLQRKKITQLSKEE